MRRVLWFFGWLGVAVWSLFSFAVYGVVNVVGEAAMRNADIFSDDPETVEGIWRLFSWLHGISTSVTLVVWGIVTLAILSIPWLFDRFAAAATAPPPAMRRPPDGVIDLQGGDYVVHPGPTPSGAVPSGAMPSTAWGSAVGHPPVSRTGPVPRIGPTRG